jgi:hypothetical protein
MQLTQKDNLKNLLEELKSKVTTYHENCLALQPRPKSPSQNWVRSKASTAEESHEAPEKPRP